MEKDADLTSLPSNPQWRHILDQMSPAATARP